jgi:hypothetical protein
MPVDKPIFVFLFRKILGFKSTSITFKTVEYCDLDVQGCGSVNFIHIP